MLAQASDVTPEVESYFRYMMDPTMVYTLPTIGEKIKVYGTYMGYSSKLDMPTIRFGLDEFWTQLDN